MSLCAYLLIRKKYASSFAGCTGRPQSGHLPSTTWDWVQKMDRTCQERGLTLEQAVGGLAVDCLERWISPAERWLTPQLDLFFWAAGRK